MTIALALHTSSGELGLSLREKNRKIKFSSWDLGRTLGQYLPEKLSEFIKPYAWQDLDFLAVAIGPGSYTSARLGVVTARTLAQQLNIPLYGFSTLEILAWYYAKTTDKNIILTVMGANQKEVHGAIYQVNLLEQNVSNILKSQIFSKEQWQEIKSIYIEKYLDKYQEVIAPEKLGNHAPDLLELAYLKWCQDSKNQQFSGWENVFPYYGEINQRPSPENPGSVVR